MTSDVQIINKFTYKNPLLNKNLEYDYIKVPDEVTHVKNTYFHNTHYYDVRPQYLHSSRHYHQPFSDVNQNIHSDFNKYRHIKGFMQPKEIKMARLQRHLSLRDLYNLTGISFSTLSEIENNNIVQNYEENMLLVTNLKSKIRKISDYLPLNQLKARIGNSKSVFQLLHKLVAFSAK